MEIIRQKNVATYISFPLSDVTGTAIEAATSPDSEIDSFNDGAAPNGWVDCTNEVVAVGSGMYSLSLTQSEMNADYINIMTKSSNAVTQYVLIRTIAHDPAVALAISGDLATHNDKLAEVSGAVVDILVDTSTTIPGTITTMQADLDDPDQYKAVITGLSLESTVSGVWSLPTRALTTPNDYKADVSALALEATVNALNDPTTKEIDDYLTGLHGSGSWEAGAGGGATAQEVWEYASPRTLTTPADYKADVSLLALETTASGVWSLPSRELSTPANYKADVSNLDQAISTTESNIRGGTETLETLSGLIATDIVGIDTLSGYIAPLQVDLDNPAQYKADVSALSTSGHVADVGQDVVTVDTVVDAIKVKTDNLPANTSGILDVIRGLVGHNSYATFTWATDDNTLSVVQVYDSAFNAGVHDGSSGLLDSYSVTGTYSSNKLQTFKMVKD